MAVTSSAGHDGKSGTLPNGRGELARSPLVADRYEIERELGHGGMGRVVVAFDRKLGRKVALKMLAAGLQGEDALLRFAQEARAAGALNHPNILDIHDVGSWQGEPYIVSELLEGVTLAERLRQGSLPSEEAAALTVQLAQGLCAAHDKGVIHRDLKPENLFITREGRLKILDFGIAKLVAPPPPRTSVTLPSSRPRTQTGAILGTVGYMCPEQVRGEPVDHRSDLFSCGVILYEMLTGRTAFDGDTPVEIGYAILNDAVPALPDYVPPQLASIVRRCLEKKPQNRFESAHELALRLQEFSSRGTAATARRWRLTRSRVAWFAALSVAIAALSLWLVRRESQIRWAREQAIPKVAALVEKGRYLEAFPLALRAEQVLPGDSTLAKLWPEISRDYSVETAPDGAAVYTKEYTAGEHEWQYLGRSPIAHARLPVAFHRWRIQKEGFVAVEAASSGYDQWPLLYWSKAATLRFVLDRASAVPEGMVRVPASSASLEGLGVSLPPVELPDYFLDRTEVTNRQYRRFVDAGGYRTREPWKREFVRDGRTLSWEEAMASFRDRTGRPGPSTWESGDYPEGQADFPVTGVSWFEADAYAAFVGKALPTVYHWSEAAGLRIASYIVPLSNFEGKGPSPVGSHRGIGPYGTEDMAGNAKEWCWNATGEKRFILGGSWSEASYTFTSLDAQSPFDRAPNYGFRLARYADEAKVPKAATDPIRLDQRDYRTERPVSDEVFNAYKSLYSYDKADLKSIVESVDDSAERWRQETVTFGAAYGNERVIAHLFIPRHVRPPYQTVVIFPPGSAQDLRSSKELSLYLTGFLVKSGRAMLFPIYKSTYERGEGPEVDLVTAPTALYRDHVLQWSKDLARSLDYIESRKDLDAGKVALYGISWGARMTPLLIAVEPRIKAAVLVGGGLGPRRALPEADPINFASRVRQPVLMVNGRYDAIYQLDSSQRPLFDLLRVASAQNKRHVLTESGHLPPSEVVTREALDWLDLYLGPVQ